MNRVSLTLSEESAKELYRLLHRGDGQQDFPELYQQLQSHFFGTLTIAEIQQLLGEDS